MTRLFCVQIRVLIHFCGPRPAWGLSPSALASILRARLRPDLAPTWPRPPPDFCPLLTPTSSVVLLPQLLHVDQAGEELGSGRRAGIVEQFVDERLPPAATVDQEVFQLFQAFQVDLELRMAPAGELADVPAAESVVGTVDALPLAGGRDHFVHEPQQPAGLRRQFIDRPPQALRRPAGSPRRCRQA